MRHLLTALTLIICACTAPAPEARFAAEPCDFRDPRDICPDCEPRVLIDESGQLKHIQVNMDGEWGEYAHTYDYRGRLLGVQEGAIIHGCHVETGTVWFDRNLLTGYVGCWNEDGDPYECYGTPETWIADMDRAAQRH